MMPGKVVEQRVRCGKDSCKCARGQFHSAFYRYWTEGGCQRKAYVRRRDLGATREACRKWTEADATVAAILRSPEAASERAEMRATLQEAVGDQTKTPGGQRLLRRLR